MLLFGNNLTSTLESWQEKKSFPLHKKVWTIKKVFLTVLFSDQEHFSCLGTEILLKKWPNFSMKSILANTECTIYALKDPTKRTIFWAAPWKGS